ncbi:MAG: DNA cytosine methyltransferase [Nitrobacter sp.]|uniref:DNA cytosine methyltransferase n=1 Tax=Nitrobacter sp. TaxID=29420 RepID=UPI00260A4D5F|nr:DNA cytosine methyltransferase [Nitrobacter sp.]MCV0388089.1 DNA cytosine methyltransferase [Nitrobacter sp.]
MNRKLTAIDLYSGAGGATQGLKDAGVQVLAAIEVDPIAARSYRLNHPEVLLRRRDIRSCSATGLRRSLGLARGELAVLQACPPCPSWSTLGKKFAGDERPELILQVRRFIKAFLPKAFILENVPGLARDGRLGSLLADAEARGYATRSYLVDAADAGVPQRRKRLIAIGVRGLPSELLPDDLLGSLPASFDRSPRTVQDAFADLVGSHDPLHRGRAHRDAVLKRIRAIPFGGDRFDLPGHLRLACHDDVGRSAGAAYGRMRLDEPAPTLTTRCTTPSCGRFVHPIEDRGITLREAALLQTFPRDYMFTGTYGSMEQQIGNAIPVRLAQAVGTAASSLIQGAT